MIKTVEVEQEGFLKLLGKQVTIFSLNYIYHGELTGVNESCLLLKNPKIVYETGSYDEKTFKDAQALNVDEWYVQISTIESFGVLNKK